MGTQGHDGRGGGSRLPDGAEQQNAVGEDQRAFQRGRAANAAGSNPNSFRNQNGDPTTKNAVELLLQAIRGKKKVGFQYISTGSDGKKHLHFDGAEYRLSPYTLFCRQDRYYLIGSMEESRKLLYFRLDRIRALRLLEDSSLPAEQLLGPNADLQLRDYVDRNLYNHGGSATVIRLIAELLRLPLI